ncbi:hypothetical protein NDU88_005764 [Pleurodeles waltl]|uniref:Uncharacterized protein n=1 Tax=Pleurodeles waltl TaxID=8319 RepID=A0AAV7WZ83_PLEWA|nr:hypothetical protein NDU88_005764 [Pleurodeles waltl]
MVDGVADRADLLPRGTRTGELRRARVSALSEALCAGVPPPEEAGRGSRQWKEGPRGPLKAEELTKETQAAVACLASYERKACSASGCLTWALARTVVYGEGNVGCVGNLGPTVAAVE